MQIKKCLQSTEKRGQLARNGLVVLVDNCEIFKVSFSLEKQAKKFQLHDSNIIADMCYMSFSSVLNNSL